MKAKAKVGPQTLLDYQRSVLPASYQVQQLAEHIAKSSRPKPSTAIPVSRSEKSETGNSPAKENNQVISPRKQQLLLQSKSNTKHRVEQKLFEVALQQQQSNQYVDDHQVEILLRHSSSPIQIQQLVLKSSGREYLSGSAPYQWNNLTAFCPKTQSQVFTNKVIQYEKQGIQNIKQRFQDDADNNKIIQRCFDQGIKQKKEAIRKTHNENLRKEQDLKQGVFGKNVKDSQNKLHREPIVPESYLNDFPHKYPTSPYIEKLKQIPIPEKQMQLYTRLSSPKKQYEPTSLLQHSEFNGMIAPAIDKIMCVKQSELVNHIKGTSPHIPTIIEHVNDSKRITSNIIQRPQTANSQAKGFKIEPLSSFDHIQPQRSFKYLYQEQQPNEMVSEIDSFAKKLKESRPLSGFSRVSRKEYDLLRSPTGYKIVRDLKKLEAYPQNLDKVPDKIPSHQASAADIGLRSVQ